MLRSLDSFELVGSPRRCPIHCRPGLFHRLALRGVFFSERPGELSRLGSEVFCNGKKKQSDARNTKMTKPGGYTHSEIDISGDWQKDK